MITSDEIKKIAKLSMISISEDEIPQLQKDFSEFLKLTTIISSAVVDFDSEEEWLHTAYNKDVVEQSFARDEILKNSQNRKGEYFFLKLEQSDKTGEDHEQN